MNARAKGRRGELLFCELLEKAGYPSKRCQTEKFASGKDGADVEAEGLERFHFEVKNQEKLNIWNAWEQARADAEHRGKTPLVAFKRNRSGWFVAMDAETFFRLVEQ